MLPIIYSELKQDDDFLSQLDHNIWLMDNHKWALYAWEVMRQKLAVNKFTLVHADYHWDGVDDFLEKPELVTQLLEARPTQLLAMTKAGIGIREGLIK